MGHFVALGDNLEHPYLLDIRKLWTSAVPSCIHLLVSLVISAAFKSCMAFIIFPVACLSTGVGAQLGLVLSLPFSSQCSIIGFYLGSFNKRFDEWLPFKVI